MAAHFDTSPEVVPPSNAPEVYDARQHQAGAWQPYGSFTPRSMDNTLPFDRNDSQVYSSGAPTLPPKSELGSPVAGTATPARQGKRRSICGCSFLVFVLISALIICGAAIIGLAAATGISMRREKSANSELSAMRASSLSEAPTVTVTSSGPASTADEQERLTHGCSRKNEKTSRTVYESKFFNSSFTMYCNRNAPNDPIFSLFATTLDGCIEACATWNNRTITETTCEGVSFVPFWAVIGNAAKNDAPGDCYLKPGPQDRDGLEDAQDTHAAILKD
ncbi:hypothetical protein FZEAL_4506 [Fusarium zealandicum]|uniref:Uncharacterized protein n=1 Tax=Fusarium zealandicum TaxID=1053134 RepID=A0A8H4XLI2_9HYPO|nr:hypothetical protein FZEAL_4506 [Fusarium zealandicum]